MPKDAVDNPAPMTLRSLWVVVAIGAAISAVFLAFPGIDPWVSGLIWRPADGFYLAEAPLGVAIRYLVTLSVGTIAVVALSAFVVKLLRPGWRPLVDLRTSLHLLLSLALGPGLIVNTVLKDNWGRPRPVHLQEFGGDMTFQDIWVIGDQCARNCSFVSGEAAAGFYLLALVPLTRPYWRPWVAGGAIAWGLAVSAARVVQGGHFVSDVLLAGVVTFVVIWLVHTTLYRWLAPVFAPDRLANGCAVAHDAVGGVVEDVRLESRMRRNRRRLRRAERRS